MKAVDNLKYSLNHAPVLELLDPDVPVSVVADASDFGCDSGAVLLQNQRSEAFHSHNQVRAQPRGTAAATSSQLLAELLAVMVVLQRWRCQRRVHVCVLIASTDHTLLRLAKGLSLRVTAFCCPWSRACGPMP